MIGLCNECFSSGKEVEIWRDTGETVCKKCKAVRKNRLLKSTGKLTCTCRPCPIHENEPHSTLEQKEAETIPMEAVEG